jgi:tetratricopeptide (TPR) repeat protein
VFAVQDEITRNVVTELAVKLTRGELARSLGHDTENFEAWDYFMQADKLFFRFEKESNAKARELVIKAIELDQKYAYAIALLGWTHLMDAWHRWVENPTQSIKRAEDLAARALAIDDNVFSAHMLWGSIYASKRLYEQAIAAKERAVECEPNNAMAIASLAETMILVGRPQEGLVLMKKAMRLSPYPPSYFYSWSMRANYLTGDYEAAIAEYQKYLQRHRGPFRASRLWLIASYMELGREEEARAEAQKLLQQYPDWSIEAYKKIIKGWHPSKDYAFLDRQIELLLKAGIPEE